MVPLQVSHRRARASNAFVLLIRLPRHYVKTGYVPIKAHGPTGIGRRSLFFPDAPLPAILVNFNAQPVVGWDQIKRPKPFADVLREQFRGGIGNR